VHGEVLGGVRRKKGTKTGDRGRVRRASARGWRCVPARACVRPEQPVSAAPVRGARGTPRLPFAAPKPAENRRRAPAAPRPRRGDTSLHTYPESGAGGRRSERPKKTMKVKSRSAENECEPSGHLEMNCRRCQLQ